MKIENANAYFESLKHYYGIEKCIKCECLQGMLVQIRLDWPALRLEVEQFIAVHSHKCIGCESCPPAELWVRYLKEKEV